MDRQAEGTKQLIGITIGAGAVGGTGVGVGLYALGGGIGGITTLGTLGRVAGPAATGGTALLNQLSRTDQRVFEIAKNLGMSATNAFMKNVEALGGALSRAAPGANYRAHWLGDLGGSPIYGSLTSRIGIAEVNGVTVVVKALAGKTPEVLGKLPF